MRLFCKTMCGVAVITAALAAACSSGGGGGSNKNSIRGLVVLTQADQPWHVAEGCSGAGDYGDIKKGTQVRATDQDGKQIGKASLGAGRGEEDDGTDSDGSETHICQFPFGIANVDTIDSYTVTVGNRADASQTRSFEEFRSSFWQVQFAFPNASPAP